MDSTQRRNRKARERQGYEPETPHCGNCANFQPAQRQSPTPPAGEVLPTHWKPFQVARCLWGDFPVQTPHGICNDWRGRDGSLLER